MSVPTERKAGPLPPRSDSSFFSKEYQQWIAQSDPIVLAARIAQQPGATVAYAFELWRNNRLGELYTVAENNLLLISLTDRLATQGLLILRKDKKEKPALCKSFMRESLGVVFRAIRHMDYGQEDEALDSHVDYLVEEQMGKVESALKAAKAPDN